MFLTEQYCKAFIDETDRTWGRFMGNAIDKATRRKEETNALDRILSSLLVHGKVGAVRDAVFYQWSRGRIMAETILEADNRLIS